MDLSATGKVPFPFYFLTPLSQQISHFSVRDHIISEWTSHRINTIAINYTHQAAAISTESPPMFGNRMPMVSCQSVFVVCMSRKCQLDNSRPNVIYKTVRFDRHPLGVYLKTICRRWEWPSKSFFFWLSLTRWGSIKFWLSRKNWWLRIKQP